MILELGSVASRKFPAADEQQKKKGAGGLGAAFWKEAWGVHLGREFRPIFLGRISAEFFGRISADFFWALGKNFRQFGGFSAEFSALG